MECFWGRWFPPLPFFLSFCFLFEWIRDSYLPSVSLVGGRLQGFYPNMIFETLRRAFRISIIPASLSPLSDDVCRLERINLSSGSLLTTRSSKKILVFSRHLMVNAAWNVWTLFTVILAFFLSFFLWIKSFTSPLQLNPFLRQGFVWTLCEWRKKQKKPKKNRMKGSLPFLFSGLCVFFLL